MPGVKWARIRAKQLNEAEMNLKLILLTGLFAAFTWAILDSVGGVPIPIVALGSAIVGGMVMFGARNLWRG